MRTDVEIQDTDRAAATELETLYGTAFPDEDLVSLVHALIGDGDNVFTFTATSNECLLGHAALSTCAMTGSKLRVALLGPVCVAPEHQRTGIGGALIRHCLEKGEQIGMSGVCVLGDPAYYERHGFAPEPTLRTPYPIPEEWGPAWQSVWFDKSLPPTGTLIVPDPWKTRALWMP
ncbi:MAG: N-acetyltransferase [Pseudomonadota bacterium]